MPTEVRRWLTPAAWVAAVVAALLAIFPLGFPNYDTIYALVWGRELAHGVSPDYGAALPPTPHPLADLLGLVTTPLGGGAVGVTMVIAYLSLGLVAYLVYRLGALWFDRPIGVVAALFVLTRAPYLSNGLRAYVDLPYIVLVLAALLIVTKRPRAGWPVLALLALAGLLRPEAWLFSFAYLAYLLIDFRKLFQGRRIALRSRAGTPEDRGESPSNAPNEEAVGMPLEPADTQKRGLIRPRFVGARGIPTASTAALILLTVAAPLLWAAFDWVTAGSPTYSFTGTQHTVETLARKTGPVDLVLYGPRALGEVMQWPGMIGALGGVLIAVAILAPRRKLLHFPHYDRERVAIGLVAAVLALGAFAILACAGLAIIARYTMLAGAILAIFVGLGLLGWRLLERGHPWRTAWQLFAAIVALVFVVWIPNQRDLLSQVDTDLTNQGQIESDLGDLAESGAFEPLCLPISVPNHRAVPRLAFDLEVRPSRIVSSSEQQQPRRGYFLEPASPFVIHNFILDPNDPSRFPTAHPPPGFRRVARNRSWVLYRHC